MHIAQRELEMWLIIGTIATPAVVGTCYTTQSAGIAQCLAPLEEMY